MYGLCQAGRAWNQLFSRKLNENGYESLDADECILIKQSKTGKLMIFAIFVDDITVFHHRDDKEEFDADRKSLESELPLEDLGEARAFSA